jgi:hypothetical protein
MLGGTRPDEHQLRDIEIEILWQRDRDGVWSAILDTGEQVRLVEPWEGSDRVC